MDRLPYGRFHRRVLICSVLVFLFESGDQIATGLVAPSLPGHLGTSLNGVAFVVSSMFLGILVGSLLAGQGDHLGRRALLSWGLVTMSVFSGLSALSVNVEMLVAMRFFAGIGLGLCYIGLIVYLAEVFPARRRAFALGLSMCIAAVGTVALTLLARFVVPAGDHGWRVVFAVGLLGLLAVPAVRTLPESPRWLMAQGREAEAEAALRGIEEDLEKRHGQLPEPELPAEPAVVEPASASPPSPTAAGQDTGTGALFRGLLLRGTVMVMIIWVCHALGAQIMSTWTPTVLRSRGYDEAAALSMASLMALGILAGAAVSVFAGDRLPRRGGIVAFTVIAAVSMAVFGLAPSAVVVVLAGAMVQFSFGAGTPLITAYAAEQFPTVLRARGSGIGYSVGRVTSVVAPFTIAGVLQFLGTGAVAWGGFLAWGLIAVTVLTLGTRGPSRAARRPRAEPTAVK